MSLDLEKTKLLAAALNVAHFPIERRPIDIPIETDALMVAQEPINILYFYMDWGDPRRHNSVQTLIANSIKTARAMIPNCRILLLTDQKTCFSDVISIDEIIRQDLNPDLPMYERMRLQRDYLSSPAFDANTVMIDCDVFFNKDIRSVFQYEFSVGFTFRHYAVTPLNGGVILVKKNEDQAALTFFDMMLACYNGLAEDPRIVMIFRNPRAWGGDELAITNLLGFSGLLYNNLNGLEVNKIKVLLLACDDYNFSPYVGIRYPLSYLQDKYMIHFVGNTKALAIPYLREQWGEDFVVTI